MCSLWHPCTQTLRVMNYLWPRVKNLQARARREPKFQNTAALWTCGAIQIIDSLIKLIGWRTCGEYNLAPISMFAWWGSASFFLFTLTRVDFSARSTLCLHFHSRSHLASASRKAVCVTIWEYFMPSSERAGASNKKKMPFRLSRIFLFLNNSAAGLGHLPSASPVKNICYL